MNQKAPDHNETNQTFRSRRPSMADTICNVSRLRAISGDMKHECPSRERRRASLLHRKPRCRPALPEKARETPAVRAQRLQVASGTHEPKRPSFNNPPLAGGGKAKQTS